MRIRRTIIAPVILTLPWRIGSLVAAPAVAAMTAVAPAATSVASTGNAYVYHT